MSTHNLVKSLRADRSQLASEVRQLRAEVERAKRALLSHGFTDCGGAEWKPPLGPHPGTLLAEVERLRALDKEAKSAFAPWVQGPGIVGGILHLQEEVERLRAEANARAVEELLEVYRVGRDGAALWSDVVDHLRKRIAELSKPAAKESEPVRGGEKIETWVDDWTVSLADEAKATHAEEPAEEASAKLLAMVVEGLCNLGREVRRGGKS